MGKREHRTHFVITMKVSGPVTWKLVTGTVALVLAPLSWLAWYLMA